MEKCKVTFYPDNVSIEVEKDTTILSAAISCGIYINSACGGDGVCGKCKVFVRKGKTLTQPTGILSADEKEKKVQLACLSFVQENLEVMIPDASRISLDGLTPAQIHERTKGMYTESEEVVVPTAGLVDGVFAFAPLVSKHFLMLPPPMLHDPVGDLERVTRGVRKIPEAGFKADIAALPTGLVNIRQLGELLRASEWKVTVGLWRKVCGSELIFVEPGNTAQRNYGFAFDIGTTTISGQLVDLTTKRVIGTKAIYNKQIAFGSDVITRIMYAKEKDGLEQLHLAVIDCIDQIIEELTREHSVDLNDVTALVIAGNTTMIHLLLSIDPTYIRKEPYVATANVVPALRACEIGIRINPRGPLACVPGVASYVGGDVTAGVLSCGMDREDDVCILIDIGTNGEIVLGNKEFLVSCAASAGPAFEGSGVTCGMRATQGAIQKVIIDPDSLDVTLEVIGKTAPKGICGSGYIDCISEMLRVGLIDRSGRFKRQDTARIRDGENGKEFIVCSKEASAQGIDIVITEPDIDNIKRAKAAIYSATATLLKHTNLSFDNVKKVFIAGGFGTSIDIDKAIAIGLLPDIDKKRFIFVGNSSLAGARQLLLSFEAMAQAHDIAKKMAYFELSVDTAYMDEYMAALFFPHTDLTLFPSANK
ncbi:MAG: DUF4445 domain-containing protein [Candidatus Omnitrophica bacterium]|nr:DUF4445 domain-containing protein [Candidatus Omnitrophota bacterium]